jgi:uncharacterized protein DUF2330
MIKPVQVSFSKKILIFILFLLLFLTSIILADGCFKGPSPAVPGIPYQSAIIRYKDGEETLIIQSYLESEEGSNFGWIIPLPEKPSSVKPFSPGVFKCLPFCFNPKLKNHRISIYILIICWIILWIIITYCRIRNVLYILFLFILVSMFLALFIPNYLGVHKNSISAFSDINGIKTLDSGIAGNYEFSILEADNSKALDKWLKMNELHTFLYNEKDLVDEYISEKWVFAVARIKRNEKQKIAAPHPISFKFKTDKAVYPMRLTGLSSKLPYLYLYIISDEKAVVKGYTNMFSDTLKYNKGVYWSLDDEEWKTSPDKDGPAVDGVWRSVNYKDCWIAHPAFQPLLYEGCFLTVLSAKVDKFHVKNDAYIKFSGKKPERLSLHREDMIVKLSYLWSIILILSAFLIYLIHWDTSGRRWKIPWRIYPLAIVLIIIISPIFRSLYTSAEDWDMVSNGVDYYVYRDDLFGISFYTNKDIKDSSQMAEKELEDFIINNSSQHEKTNPYTEKKIIKEDSPGNFTLRKNEKGEWILTMYDLNGTPYEQILVDKK